MLSPVQNGEERVIGYASNTLTKQERQYCVTRKEFLAPSHGCRTSKNQILQDMHGGVLGEHLGKKKTLSQLKERLYWPGQSEGIKKWCQNCPHCAMIKTPVPKKWAPLQSMKASYPMKRVAVDIVGPFPQATNGNLYVLVAADNFTRWMEAYAVPNQEAAMVASKLVQIVCQFSIPDQLH